MGPMYIETPYIIMYIRKLYITMYNETPYIFVEPCILHICSSPIIYKGTHFKDECLSCQVFMITVIN